MADKIKIIHILGRTNHGREFERLIIDPEEGDTPEGYLNGNEFLSEHEIVELAGSWEAMPFGGTFERTDI